MNPQERVSLSGKSADTVARAVRNAWDRFGLWQRSRWLADCFGDKAMLDLCPTINESPLDAKLVGRAVLSLPAGWRIDRKGSPTAPPSRWTVSRTDDPVVEGESAINLIHAIAVARLLDFYERQRRAVNATGHQKEMFPGPDKVVPGATEPPFFDGETYEAEADRDRLAGLLRAVFLAMADGQWRALPLIQHIVRQQNATWSSEASISARLRDLRKERFGAHKIERRRKAEGSGTYQYRLTINRKD